MMCFGTRSHIGNGDILSRLGFNDDICIAGFQSQVPQIMLVVQIVGPSPSTGAWRSCVEYRLAGHHLDSNILVATGHNPSRYCGGIIILCGARGDSLDRLLCAGA